MAITASIFLVQSVPYPVVGQLVTLGASGVPSGERIRWRLISAPATSALVLYTARNQVYLQDGKVQPDVEGKYIFDAVEEEFISHIPHFDGDNQGNGPVEQWDEIGSTSYSLYVGCKMQRQIGQTPDQVTLELYNSDNNSTHGILTALYSEEFAPRLTSPTSERAKIVLGATVVLTDVASIGGHGYSGSSVLLLTDGTSSSMLHRPYALLTAVTNAYQQHLAIGATNKVHLAADAVAAASIALTSAATELTSLCTLANSLKAIHNTHRLTVGGVHIAAETSSAVLSADAATLNQALTLTNELRSAYEMHRKAWDTTGGGTGPHPSPSDGRASARIAAPVADSLPTCITLANDVRTKMTVHVNGGVIVGSGYHPSNDVDNVLAVWSNSAADEPSFISKVNELMDLIGSHMSNIKHSDKSTVGYHTVKDYGGARLLEQPKASNMTEAIVALDVLYYYLMRHVCTIDRWHNDYSVSEANPGTSYVPTWGVTQLTYDFMTALAAENFDSPPNALISQTNLISLGGFTKA